MSNENTLEILTSQNFSQVLTKLKEGALAYRQGWNGIIRGIDMYVMLIQENDLGYAPHFIFYNSEHKSTNIWVPSMWDMMGNDWTIQETKNEIDMQDHKIQTVERALDGSIMEIPEKQ